VNLLAFQKPGRYINREANSIYKKAPVNVALAFPDIYEVGMSHLGLRILYGIINNLPFASAERVFSPWLDLDDAMRKQGVLLSSLESKRPLGEFDIIGFSLQYELSYTSVLNMLHLGGIPLKSEERLNKKGGPLVIAGGPCTINPMPMSAFIDAFLIGDGEDAITDILNVYHEWKKDNTEDKLRLFSALSEIEGVFVPSVNKDKKVTRRILHSLEDAFFPDKPVVPFTTIIHDRVNIEIARGCSMGCRFCQAGMAYRPVRERSPEKVLALAENSLKNTGYDSISFTSLSAGDYSCLHQLLREFNKRFFKKRISASLPSLRVASVNSDILNEIKAVRKTGFTIAPEAGTDRLRSVINKDFTSEIYTRTLETLFKSGWNNLKMYFMSGLPTETDEDISAVPEMVFEAIKISKRLTGRRVNISVGISSFVPKPHTPFQWFGQNDLNILKEKNAYLKRAFLRRGVKYKGHNEEMSMLEAAFARGDKSLSGLIEKAWACGCRLDAWTESFDFEKWKNAMDASGIDAANFAARKFDKEAALPWDNINTGITKEYLLGEYMNALSGKYTPDCRQKCHNCGLKCKLENNAPAFGTPSLSKRGKGEFISPPLRAYGSEPTAHRGGPACPVDRDKGEGAVCGFTNDRISRSQESGVSGQKLEDRSQDLDNFVKVRLEYSKTGTAGYLSHLELTTSIIRAMRRAGFPFRYSSGFHPAPVMSFGPALKVGVGGLKEYLDLELIAPVALGEMLEGLNRTLPEGIRAGRIGLQPGGEKSLNSFIIRYAYRVSSESGLEAGGFAEKGELTVTRKETVIDIREMVMELLRIDEKTFDIIVCDKGEIKARLDDILPAIFNKPVDEMKITRTAMYGWKGRWSEPMEAETNGQ
jgi:radical SAM family uncharacterized protein/radical SAM-linked protein